MNISRIGPSRRYGIGFVLIVMVPLLFLFLGSISSNGADTGVMPYPNAPGSFTELVKRVGPEVVNISTTKVIKRGPMVRPFGNEGPWRDFFGDDFFERFFGQMPRERKQRSLGSGVIIDPQKGYILTNNHVIAGADEITVRLDDGKEYNAEVVGRDPKTDLALIRTKVALDVDAGAPLGDSDKVEIGEWVMAIGNPFGLERTVTVGILSAKGRVIGAGPYDDFLQTDAAINPGNSGGPLFNMKGEVIGINTAIVASGQGIGFAIPINMAKELLPQLEKGKVTRGWLGVSIQEVTEDIAKSFKLKDAKGALVAEVMEDTPAKQGGIERGDIITSFDGKEVETPNELQRIVASTAPDKKVKVEVIRDGKTRTLTVKLGTMPEEITEAEKGVTTDLGLTVQTLTPELAEQFNWSRDEKGVLITGVDPSGAGADAGLRRGDLIKEIDRQDVETTEDYSRILGKAKKGESVLFLVKRGTRTFYITLTPESE
ncbi:MAG: DegQ family serine endoprotease [Deltaproteobacteria bacterium]|nr:DegQ family serine endoprotease [Deltaproteobacteria bacterium]